jgi:hypothetical protein
MGAEGGKGRVAGEKRRVAALQALGARARQHRPWLRCACRQLQALAVSCRHC